MVMSMLDSVASERFAGLSMPEPNSGCWLWLGRFVPNGYGKFSVNGEQLLAHRVAWEQARGPIPRGALVRHRCDTPSCVNPDHLLTGNTQDNSDDMKARRRQAVGERVYTAALTAADVVEIRRRAADRTVSYAAMAQDYSVRPGAIRAAIVGVTWAHVPGAIADHRWERNAPTMRGEHNPAAALTAPLVLRLRHIHRDIGLTYFQLAKLVGVAARTMKQVLHGVTWRHVADACELTHRRDYGRVVPVPSDVQRELEGA